MRKRSKYRPRPVLQNPLDFVLSGMQPLSRLKDQFLMMQIKHREALEQVRTGNATKDDIDRLIAMANMSESLAIHGKRRFQSYYTNRDSMVPITFPYTPTTEHVERTWEDS